MGGRSSGVATGNGWGPQSLEQANRSFRPSALPSAPELFVPTGLHHQPVADRAIDVVVTPPTVQVKSTALPATAHAVETPIDVPAGRPESWRTVPTRTVDRHTTADRPALA